MLILGGFCFGFIWCLKSSLRFDSLQFVEHNDLNESNSNEQTYSCILIGFVVSFCDARSIVSYFGH